VLELASSDPPTVLKAQSLIKRQINHLVRLVDDLLDISRVTSGKVQLRSENIDLRDAIRRRWKRVGR